MQKTEIQDIEQIKVDKMVGTARVCLQKVFFKHALESKLERNKMPETLKKMRLDKFLTQAAELTRSEAKQKIKKRQCYCQWRSCEKGRDEGFI